ncbi:Carboxymuconolactone decarboxylase [Gluconacetobacter diazotrophicus PA1 5]|uniref:carboxymuconolactone decarboxylase family protein n=1 Tax=Gluconacetobacter diazotrophicus TaxID=33996 RepID=UPI000173BE65|nr:carboxymuconolactone decarboxylase family protein [Gluconacetobacter diazotrophicus]ACI50736.1 Carboxymuconolactone decarboxylase [Gluconacetobacter diazotrophicus PA1 5]
MADERFTEGKRAFEEITGVPASAFLDSLATTAPELGRFVMEWEFADVYGQTRLDARLREAVMIASCAARGATAAGVLRLRIGSALRAGLTRREIADICVQTGIIAGVPAALSALQIAGEVFAGTPEE